MRINKKKLDRWKKDKGMNYIDFGKAIGYNDKYLFHVIAGRVKLNQRLINAIQLYTGMERSEFVDD